MADTTTTIASSSAVLLAVLAVILSMGGNPAADNWYYGIDNTTEISCKPMQCDSLSGQNEEGISSRCYYFSEEKNRSTYKTCSDGWIKFEKVEQSSPIDFNDRESVYLYCIKKDKSLVSNCQVVDGNQSIIKLENN